MEAKQEDIGCFLSLVGAEQAGWMGNGSDAEIAARATVASAEAEREETVELSDTPVCRATCRTTLQARTSPMQLQCIAFQAGRTLA